MGFLSCKGCEAAEVVKRIMFANELEGAQPSRLLMTPDALRPLHTAAASKPSDPKSRNYKTMQSLPKAL